MSGVKISCMANSVFPRGTTKVLARGGRNGERAEPFVVRLADAHPEVLMITQQQWRIAHGNRSWDQAIEAGEDLVMRDSLARSDSTFYLKLGTAYRAVNRHYDEIQTLAHAAKMFPDG